MNIQLWWAGKDVKFKIGDTDAKAEIIRETGIENAIKGKVVEVYSGRDFKIGDIVNIPFDKIYCKDGQPFDWGKPAKE